MGIYQKSWPTYRIEGTSITLSEISKRWLTYEESIAYVRSLNGILPSLEEIALLRAETHKSRDEFNDFYREARKYQASRTFAAYWKSEEGYLMAITENSKDVNKKTSFLVCPFELINLDDMLQHQLIIKLLGNSCDAYKSILKESGYEYITIHMPTIEELSTLRPHELSLYNTGLGGDDSGMNEINLNLKDFKTRALAVIK